MVAHQLHAVPTPAACRACNVLPCPPPLPLAPPANPSPRTPPPPPTHTHPQNTITSLNDVRQDDDISPLSVIELCSDLEYPLVPYDDAATLCLTNDVADGPCPANSYPVLMVPDLNKFDEKDTAYKVCGLCPAGTAGEGFGCTTCPAGTYSGIGGDCNPCPAGTYSNAGSSVCIPCPTGTYAAGEGTQECSPW